MTGAAPMSNAAPMTGAATDTPHSAATVPRTAKKKYHWAPMANPHTAPRAAVVVSAKSPLETDNFLDKALETRSCCLSDVGNAANVPAVNKRLVGAHAQLIFRLQQLPFFILLQHLILPRHTYR